MNASPGATRELGRRIGRHKVRTEAEVRFAASFDNARLSFLPDAVVVPEELDDVGATLQLANSLGVGVTVRGAGSSTTGSASPVEGGWVLDLSGWRKLSIDSKTGMAYAQAGATVESVHRAAEAKGWFYPPDPSSLRYATVGGTIACNAGGMRGAKYGVTRDYVLALEGFLPTGEYVRWGADLRKFSSGYNLRDLWVGSEGTLGIITGAILRLVPRPRDRVTLLASFKRDSGALEAVASILGHRVVPSILEFLDRQTVRCVRIRARQRQGSQEREVGEQELTAVDPERPEALLLMELDGHPAAVEEEREVVEGVLKGLAREVRESREAKRTAQLWEVRRTCSQAMFHYGGSKLNEDVVVPLRSQKALLRYTLQLRRETGLATPTFGHAADGNFHVHLMFDRENPAHLEAAERGVRALMERVVALGGAISGEHGIGLAKSAFLGLQHGPAEIAAMRAVKQALDPRGVLNPGKIFRPFPVWKVNPVAARMPWDH